MTPLAFLESLRARGGRVLVSEDGQRLRLYAPVGVLTPKVRRYVEQHKPVLLNLLRSVPEQPHPSGLVDPFAADNLADNADNAAAAQYGAPSRLPPPEYPNLLPSYGGHADPRTAEFGRLLLFEARRGTLPPRRFNTSSSDNSVVVDANVEVLALYARCLAARERGDDTEAEAAANAFFDWCEWWHDWLYRRVYQQQRRRQFLVGLDELDSSGPEDTAGVLSKGSLVPVTTTTLGVRSLHDTNL